MVEFEVGIKVTGKDAGGSASISAVGNAAGAASQQVNRFNKSASDSGKAADRAANSFRGWLPHIRTTGAALGVYFGVRSVKNVIDMADAFTNMGARLRLVSASAQEAATAQEQLFRISQANQTALIETTTLYTRAAVGLKDMGKSQADVLKTVDALGKALKISGASTSEATAGLLQFGQAMTSGVVNGDEFRSIVENMPRVAKAMADGMGITLGQLRKMSEEQRLTSEKAVDALMTQTNQLNSEASKIPLTVGRAWTELSNAMLKYVGEANEAYGLADKLAKSLEYVADHAKAVGIWLTLPQRAIEGWKGMIALMREAIGLRPQISSEMLPGDRQAINNVYGVNQAISPEEHKAKQQENWASWTQSQESQLDLVKAMDKYNETQKKNIEIGIKMAEKYQLDAAFVLAIMERETHFGYLPGNPTLTSSAGARGPMQLMPGTATRYGVRDINDAEQNIQGGARYLRDLMAMFKDMKLAAAAYNAGEHNVMKYGNKVPPFNETRKYVGIQPDPKAPSVMENYSKWSAAMGDKAQMLSHEQQIKELQQYHKDVYEEEVSHLQRRSSLYDAHAKAELERQQTAMQQLEIDRKEAQKRSEADIANAGVNGPQAVAEATKKAEAEQLQFLEKKKAMLLDTLKVEERVARERVISIGQQIAKGSDPRSPVTPDALKDLRAQQRQELIELSGFQEKRKQLEAKTAQEISQTRVEYEDKTRQAQKDSADGIVQQAEEARRAAEEELQYRQSADQYSVQAMENFAEGKKQEIDSRLEAAKLAVTAAAAERQNLMEGKTGLDAINQARTNINSELTDSLKLIEAEKQATIDKLSIDALMLDYQEQIAQAKLAGASGRDAELAAQKELLAIQAQQAANAQAYLDTLNKSATAAAKAQTDAAKKGQGLDVKEVKESQLRMNAYWDQTIDRLRQYGQVWEEILGKQEAGFGNIALSMAQFGKSLDQITAKYDELDKQGKEMDENGNTRFKETAAAVSQALAATALGMRKMFKEGSDGYKAMTALAGAAAIAQDALNITDGIAAVLKQLKEGDVYSAIPRAIAVGAMVAQLIGHAVGTIAAVAGGKGPVTAADRQKTQGTGTVLGDSAAQSNSIANSLDIIRENSSNDLNYSAAMLRALEDLSLSILALANNVAVNVMPSIDAAIKQSGMKFGMSKISLFSGFNKELTDAGIGWFEQSLTDILSGTFDAKLYADITKSFEVMGSVLSSSTKTYVAGAGAEVNTQITRIFTEIVKAFTEGGKAFGMSAENVLGALEGFTLAQQQISLKDMTMEEQQQALNAVFSNITDQMAEALNQNLGLALQPFQKAGEGMAQTFLRVSEGISRASGELERLGLTAISYRKVINTQGDVSAEIVRQTLAGQKRLAEGVRQYVNELTGKTEDIIEAYKKLIQASNLLKAAGIGDSNLDRTMINAAGGLSAFNAAMEAFNENFVSEANRYAGDVRVLAEQFGKLGYTLPTSKEGFLALVQGIDTSTVAGKKLFGQMIALSESFAQVANEADSIRAKYAAILDPFKAISDQIQQVGTDFGKLIGGVTGDSQARIDAIGNAAREARDPLTKASDKLLKRIERRFGSVAEMDAKIVFWQDKLDAELAKPLKMQNKQVIKTLQAKIARFSEFNDRLDDINQQLADITAQEGIDKAAESARLALEKQAIIDDARLAMGSTLEDIFTSIVQTIQQAQQRLQSVLDLQKSIASQIAQLQGPQAVFGLASTDRNNAFGAIDTYINSLSDGRARDVSVEVGLLNSAQQAVLAKYNAEVAAIQEAQQAYIAAETEKLNAALQLQIDAINAATEAAIKAENDRLNAAVKAQQKIDEAAIKSKQKEFDAANKLTQKQFDLEQKALQKAHDAQLKALGDELDAANKLKDAIASINDYVRGMALGGNSPLSPEQRLAEAQRQYQDLLARAQGGDADAMQKLSGASDAYLEAAKTYYGSSTAYGDIFDGVKNAMSSIGGMSAPDPDSIQSRIDLLREAQAEEMDKLRESQAERLDAIREIQADQLDAIRESQQDNLDAMREASQKTAEAIRDAAQKQIEEAQKQTQQAIADLSDPNKNEAMRAAREAAERDLGKLAELAELTRIEAAKQAEEAKQKAQEQADAALKMAQDQLAALQAGTRLNQAQLEALNSILMGNGLSAIPIPQYAKGGYAQAGLALVGEQGPEIVRFERPAQVMTAAETRDALRGGNDGKIVRAIAELKAEMRAVVVTQSNANPQIIEKLSGMEQRLSKMERTQRFTVGS